MINTKVSDEWLSRAFFYHQTEGFSLYGREGFNALVPHGSTFGHGSPLAVHLGFYPIGTDAFAAGNVFLNLVIVDGLYLAESDTFFLPVPEVAASG